MIGPASQYDGWAVFLFSKSIKMAEITRGIAVRLVQIAARTDQTGTLLWSDEAD